MSHLYDIINECDNFISISGSYWIKYINKTILKIWKKKISQIDIGLYSSEYPKIKKI